MHREILRHANILLCLGGLEKKRKRQRTSPKQLLILETTFQHNRTPDFQTRTILSKQLGMTPRRIQIWFQNKRAKLKKQKQEGNTEHNFESNTTPTASSPANLSDDSPVGGDNNFSCSFPLPSDSLSMPSWLSH